MACSDRENGVISVRAVPSTSTRRNVAILNRELMGLSARKDRHQSSSINEAQGDCCAAQGHTGRMEEELLAEGERPDTYAAWLLQALIAQCPEM